MKWSENWLGTHTASKDGITATVYKGFAPQLGCDVWTWRVTGARGGRELGAGVADTIEEAKALAEVVARTYS